MRQVPLGHSFSFTLSSTPFSLLSLLSWICVHRPAVLILIDDLPPACRIGEGQRIVVAVGIPAGALAGGILSEEPAHFRVIVPRVEVNMAPFPQFIATGGIMSTSIRQNLESLLDYLNFVSIQLVFCHE